jgi:hypothetical protein
MNPKHKPMWNKSSNPYNHPMVIHNALDRVGDLPNTPLKDESQHVRDGLAKAAAPVANL